MKEPGGFDYLDSVSKDAGDKPRQQGNLQTVQKGMDASPAEGGEGYVGGNTNASSIPAMEFVTGKKGSVESRPVWSAGETSFKYDEKDNSGTGDETLVPNPLDGSTDEGNSRFHVQDAHGLPRTWRTSSGAGDAGPYPGAANEPHSNLDASGSEDTGEGFEFLEKASKSGKPVNPKQQQKQPVPEATEGDHDMDLPQTEFTHFKGADTGTPQPYRR